MPRVASFRVGPLWVAFRIRDDYGLGPRRWSFDRDRAVIKAGASD